MQQPIFKRRRLTHSLTRPHPWYYRNGSIEPMPKHARTYARIWMRLNSNNLNVRFVSSLCEFLLTFEGVGVGSGLVGGRRKYLMEMWFNSLGRETKAERSQKGVGVVGGGGGELEEEQDVKRGFTWLRLMKLPAVLTAVVRGVASRRYAIFSIWKEPCFHLPLDAAPLNSREKTHKKNRRGVRK